MKREDSAAIVSFVGIYLVRIATRNDLVSHIMTHIRVIVSQKLKTPTVQRTYSALYLRLRSALEREGRRVL